MSYGNGRVVRVHLGAGAYYWPGWINLDYETDLKNLDYDDGQVHEIHAIHLFEHFPRLEVDEYLIEWFRVLEPGGRLVMEMPSMDKIAKLIVEGEKNLRLTLLGIFGDPRDSKPLMMHGWCWQNYELQEVLTKAGFSVEFTVPVYHIDKRDLRVIARK